MRFINIFCVLCKYGILKITKKCTLNLSFLQKNCQNRAEKREKSLLKLLFKNSVIGLHAFKMLTLTPA